MAMPTYIGRGAFAASGAAAITPALPTGLTANSTILLAFFETANQAITIPTPNGGTWNEVADSPQGVGGAGSPGGVRLTVFWSRYNGTQGDPTTDDTGNHQVGVILAFDGVKLTGDPWNVTSGGTDTAANVTVTGDTTTVDNCLIVIAVADDWDNASTTRYSSFSNANLTSLTERADGGTGGGSGGGLGIATGEFATAGAYGDTTVTQNASVPVNSAFMTIALEGVSSFDPSANHAWGQQSPVRVSRRSRMLPSGVTHIRGPRAQAEAQAYLRQRARRYAFLKAA